MKPIKIIGKMTEMNKFKKYIYFFLNKYKMFKISVKTWKNYIHTITEYKDNKSVLGVKNMSDLTTKSKVFMALKIEKTN